MFTALKTFQNQGTRKAGSERNPGEPWKSHRELRIWPY